MLHGFPYLEFGIWNFDFRYFFLPYWVETSQLYVMEEPGLPGENHHLSAISLPDFSVVASLDHVRELRLGAAAAVEVISYRLVPLPPRPHGV